MSDNSCSCDVDERPWIAIVKEMIGDGEVRIFCEETVEVVVVDKSDIDLAGGNCFKDGGVLLVRNRFIFDYCGEPCSRGVVTEKPSKSGDVVLE